MACASAAGMWWLAGLALPAAAQTPVPVPEPVPTLAPIVPEASPTPSPTPTPTPEPSASPTPAAEPSPAAQSSPVASRAAPRTRTSAPRVPVEPTARATPTPAPAPVAKVSPAPSGAPLPVPRATPATPPTAAVAAEPIDWQPWLFGGAGLVLLAMLWLRYQRDRPDDRPDIAEAAQEGAPPPRTREPSAVLLAAELRPIRAGITMISAVADCEITVTNTGSAPVGTIRVALTLLSAQGQRADYDLSQTEPIVRPVVPAFALQPGESRVVRGVASNGLNRLPAFEAGNRAMLVPMVVLNVQYQGADGSEHRLTQGFVIGVERVDSPKLAPFWLDTPRMIEQVAARPGNPPDRRRIVPPRLPIAARSRSIAAGD